MARLGFVLIACGFAACRSETKPSGSAPPDARSVPSVTAPNVASAPNVAPPPAASSTLAAFGKSIASCNWIDVVSSCTDAVPPTPADAEKTFRALYRLCKSIPKREACPSEHRVGSCRTADGFFDHYYSSGARPYTKDEAKAECENREGRWLGVPSP